MNSRVKWTCPRCERVYHVKSDVGLTVCPTCQEEMPAEATPVIKVKPYKPRTLGYDDSIFALIASVFDFRFKRYLTPRIVQLTWCMAVASVFVLVSFVVAVEFVYALSKVHGKVASIKENEAPIRLVALNQANPIARDNPLDSLAWIVSGTVVRTMVLAIVLAITLMYFRVFLEGIIVLFNMACSIDRIEAMARKVFDKD